MKIKFGAIVTDGRGKIGGHVASKNRGGAYLRTKVTPSNPNTVAQSTARTLLASIAQGWSGLTEEQRLAWNNAVSDWSKTDIFGDIKNPSGLNLYVKLNANLLGSQQSAISVPPVKVEMPTAHLVSASYSVGNAELTLVFSNTSANTVMCLVRATASLSAGTSYVKNAFRVIDSSFVASGGLTLANSYENKFGTPSIGANIFVSTQFVESTGQKSVESTVKAVVVA